MDYDITILPPKKYLLPAYETLLEFAGADPHSAKAALTARATVLLGVHPYDLHAIATATRSSAWTPPTRTTCPSGRPRG